MRHIALFFVLIFTACRPDAGDRDRQALLRADRDFAAATAREGVDAWVAAFAEDGLQFGAGGAVIRGHDAIRRNMTPFFADPDIRLEWAPSDARLGDGLGYTYGRYRVTRRSPGADSAAVLETGTYLSVWRKSADGWKVEADIGSPDPEG
ncbi:MAG TPA: nuclear transport factor 2 family protein [Longimicrobiales bacterium]|nr:nuclear transport factor 2 family protein [Longimicrobiales bacterium]